AQDLAERLTDLRIEGKQFEISLPARSGEVIRAAGRLVGGAAVVRLRPTGHVVGPPLKGGTLSRLPTLAEAQAVLANLTIPAWLLAYANPAYLHFTRTSGLKGERGTAPDIIAPKDRTRHLKALEDAEDMLAFTETHEKAGKLDLVLFPLTGGSAGYCMLPIQRA